MPRQSKNKPPHTVSWIPKKSPPSLFMQKKTSHIQISIDMAYIAGDTFAFLKDFWILYDLTLITGEFRVEGLVLRVWGPGFKVGDLGFGIQGLGCRV